MSWKTDALMLGGLGVGAYFVFVNRDKIMAWLTNQIFGPTAALPGAMLKGVIKETSGAGNDIIHIYGGAASGNTSAMGAGFSHAAQNPLVNQIFGPFLPGGSAGLLGAIGGLLTGPDNPTISNVIPASVAAPQPAPTQAQVIAALSPATLPWSSTPVSPAQTSLTAAQIYAQTFAMPGSPAWIAAGL